MECGVRGRATLAAGGCLVWYGMVWYGMGMVWYGMECGVRGWAGDLGSWGLGAVAQILSQQLIITAAGHNIITQYSARTPH